MRNVIHIKAEIIENCLQRIREEYFGFEEELKVNFTKQDSVILNLQRALQACLDLAAFIVKEKKWGIPKNSREAFDILNENQFISDELSMKLKKMVGFRNIAVHDYKKLDVNIIESIITNHLVEIEEFTSICLKLS